MLQRCDTVNIAIFDVFRRQSPEDTSSYAILIRLILHVFAARSYE